LIGRRTLIGAGASALLGTAVLFAWMHIDPVSYRRHVFQPVRAVVYFVAELNLKSGLDGIDVIRVSEPETVLIKARQPRDVDISAALYRPSSPGPAPVIVLLHGSYPWGRREGLIRVLGAELSARGWLAVAPDARGFGATSDPTDIKDPESWRTENDLRRVIDFVEQSADVEPGAIFVLGHSMGANHALEGGLADRRVKALVLVGPGRYLGEDAIEMSDWDRARFAADRDLPAPIPGSVGSFTRSLGNIEKMARAELAGDDHKPILLVDGDQEGEAKLEYLRRIVRRMDGPVEYITLENTGHYCGVRSFFGSETVFVRVELFDAFLGVLLRFLDGQRAGLRAPAGSG